LTILTRPRMTQCGDASGTGFFNVHKRTHDYDLIDKIIPELRHVFPPLIGPNGIVGTVKPEIADFFRIPRHVIVSPGSGDNMMSALGVGAVEEGDLVVSLGTSGTLFCPSSKPIFDMSGQIAPFCDATGVILTSQTFRK
jgi:xylulokinase